MKKKILAIILAAAMVFATVPAFATDNGTTYSVDESVIGTATNPLTVSYDSDGMNYVSIGDSVAYGYGLAGGAASLWDLFNYYDLPGDSDGKGAQVLAGNYTNLINKYFGVTETRLHAAICGARMQDLSTMIDAETYPGDTYYNAVLLSATGLVGIAEEWNLWEAITNVSANISKYSNEIKTLNTKMTSQLTTAIKDADFITVSAGGNNFATYPALVKSDEGLKDGKTLEDYYGKTAADAFNKLKATFIEKSGEEDKAKIENVFSTLDLYLCSLAAYVQGSNNVLDAIHKVNPNAEVAIIGIPDAYADYDLRVGSVIIDLDKVMRPLYKVLNTAIKNAAEERSSYARYIDISGVELFPSTQITDGIINYEDFASLLMGEIETAHPNYKGHKQIADRIMANFEFKTTGTYTSGVKNLINNVQTMLMSKIGLSKISNIIDSIKQINILGAIRIDLSTLIGDIFEKITNKI